MRILKISKCHFKIPPEPWPHHFCSRQVWHYLQWLAIHHFMLTPWWRWHIGSDLMGSGWVYNGCYDEIPILVQSTVQWACVSHMTN